MTNLTEYYAKRAYIPKYHLGDRVFGYWNKIPFIGTVGVDRIISENKKPEVVIMLDLPIIDKDKKINKTIIVTHEDIKPLVKL